ncbi:MAG: LLM class flavin-dependent oxidoreductase [Acidobacteria bacterium]|nr:LLM class flavin-dependent oxidoreductase [Acidobacteriota bacterium]
MRYGIVLMAQDTSTFVEMAQAAEAAGWDGIFLPDGIAISAGGKDFPFFDPWVLMGALAVKTQRIRLGTMVAAITRRRPWKLARETVTIDHLSSGRLILAAGLGAAGDDGGFGKVGEPMDFKTLAERLDECLDIMGGLWSGKPVTFSGKHYRVEKMTMLPVPVQQPRITTWVVGVWPKMKSINRTLKWDGIVYQKYKMGALEPADIRAVRELANQRDSSTPFDIVVSGKSSAKGKKQNLDQVRAMADAGATWWIEDIWSIPTTEGLFRRIKDGPPKI